MEEERSVKRSLPVPLSLRRRRRRRGLNAGKGKAEAMSLQTFSANLKAFMLLETDAEGQDGTPFPREWAVLTLWSILRRDGTQHLAGTQHS